MHKLVLLRHGESQWNLENRFTGWTNVSLTERGIQEAKNVGKLLSKNNISIDIAFTSFLKRAKDTLKFCIEEMNTELNNINYDWRLNERHYGSLQGLNKSETAKKYSDKQVKIWRRSYDIAPPPLNLNDKRHPRFDDLYKNIRVNQLPSSESLKDTLERVLPLWKKDILHNIKNGKTVMIVAHGNTLRAIIKILNNLSAQEIVKVNIPTGSPLLYFLNEEIEVNDKFYLK